MTSIKNLINLQDENGNTAIHLAATNNNFNVIKQLIDHGAISYCLV